MVGSQFGEARRPGTLPPRPLFCPKLEAMPQWVSMAVVVLSKLPGDAQHMALPQG